ncbi:hypothetical protein QBC43DRAFT_26189 [Cladorrhinum sp. PSN259]|nr:hypothetical protein QBC43DRAFT_26189 [Cladorrhinum sp. PSN259]
MWRRCEPCGRVVRVGGWLLLMQGRTHTQVQPTTTARQDAKQLQCAGTDQWSRPICGTKMQDSTIAASEVKRKEGV